MRRPQFLQQTSAVRRGPLSYDLCCFVLLGAVVGQAQSRSSNSSSSNVYIRVGANGRTVTVPTWFRSFTADWWRHNEKSPHLHDNGVKWGSAGLLTVDLASPRLRYLASQLSPAVWRIGGTPQDSVVYVVGNPPECATQDAVRRSASAPGPLCLTMRRWQEIVTFADSCGLKLVMGLNGMYGRRGPHALFNISNVREFLRSTARRKLNVFAFELSNERLRSVNGVSPDTLAADFQRVHQLLIEFWPVESLRPLLLGPDAGEGQLLRVRRFVELSKRRGKTVLDGLAYHSYCSSVPTCYSHMDAATPPLDFWPCLHAARRFLRLARENGRVLPVWAGEVGPHHGGGLQNCSDRFANAFWYLHHLGSLARLGVEVFARSTLLGGDYGLLDKATFRPRPDYFAALLWGRLMCRHHFTNVAVGGVRVNSNVPPPQVLAFACRSHRSPLHATSVTLVLINTSPECSASVELALPGWVPDGRRDEYHVSAGELLASEAMLRSGDGQWLPLRLTPDGTLPKLSPVATDAAERLLLSPMSYAFVVVPGRSAGWIAAFHVRSSYAPGMLLVAILLLCLRLQRCKCCRLRTRLQQPEGTEQKSMS